MDINNIKLYINACVCIEYIGNLKKLHRIIHKKYDTFTEVSEIL